MSNDRAAVEEMLTRHLRNALATQQDRRNTDGVRRSIGEFLYSGQGRSDIPRHITSVRVDPTVKEIAEKTFRYCERLAELELPDGLEVIGEGAFQGCKSLRRVRVPSSVRVIARDAFHNCQGLEVAELSEGLEQISWGAFNSCRSLARIRIPSTVKNLGDWAFGGCSRLEEAEVRDGVQSVGNRAFKGCKSLKRIAIPSTARVIHGGALGGCENLTEATIGEGIEEIGEKAFYNCSSLGRISIPPSVKAISSGAFECCEKLAEAELRAGLEKIEGNAFSNCTSLRYADVPSTVETIGREAFCYCGRLEEVILREGLVRIECSAFRFCTSLRHVRLPSTLRMIDRWAFSHCKLMTAEICDGIAKIDASAFEDCASLRNAALPAGARALGGFEPGCNDLVRLFGSRNELDKTLKSRFEGLPLHELCYGQSHIPAKTTLGLLQTGIGSMADSTKSPQDAAERNGNARDCLGMTPLHILACSTRHSLDVYQIVIDLQPNSLVTEDRWGCIPLLYAVWGDAPREIVELLVTSLSAIHPNVGLNWDAMFETVCRARAPIETVRALVDIQRASFPEQGIDWDKAARELAIVCLSRLDFSRHWKVVREAFDVPHTQPLYRSLMDLQRTYFPDGGIRNWQDICEEFSRPLGKWWRPESRYESVKIFRFLMKCGIPERLGRIGLRWWRTDVNHSVGRIPSFRVIEVKSRCDDIHRKLVKYEREYRQLKDSSFLLELSIWKSHFNKSIEMRGSGQSKGNCRINCGAAIIIENVLPFLINK